jgi:hypothetical protein
MDHESLGIADVCEVACQSECVDNFAAQGGVVALHPKVQHTTKHPLSKCLES